MNRKKCPQCGASLPEGALEGLCPACLLKQGASAETGPETAAFHPPTVEEVARLFPQLDAHIAPVSEVEGGLAAPA